ncbi:hypothetical protein pb186bvf_007168 [Paramecium bursaria]
MDQNRKIIGIYPMTIPASGKSVLTKGISKYYEQNNQVQFYQVSSDEVSRQLIDEYMAKNPGASFDEAFERGRGNYKQTYNKQIQNICDNIRNSNKKTFIIFFDKNHPQNAIKGSQDVLNKNFQGVIHVGVIPKIEKPLGGNLFSISYLISCIQRAIKRKNHETLQGGESKVAAVVISFFKFFSNLNKAQLDFDHIIEIPFTVENAEKEQQFRDQLMPDLKELFRQKSPDDMIKEAAPQLNRVIEFVKQNDLGFPDMKEQETILFQALQKI